MKIRLLTPSEYRTMPWKNGLGITHEIAASRSAEDERSGHFAWRLSMAEVAASAPFSPFVDCDRTIVLLDGDGLVLERGAAGRHVLDQKFAPYEFPGEWAIDGQLLGGACLDFNVIVDRRRASARVTVLTPRAAAQPVQIERPIGVIFAMLGTTQVFTDVMQSTHTLLPHHTLLYRMDGASSSPHSLTVQAQGGDAKLLLVEIRELETDRR